MTIDKLMRETANVLQRMKEEDGHLYVQRLAHEWWYWDITPPAEYYYKVGEYIKCHPDEFKGVKPQ